MFSNSDNSWEKLGATDPYYGVLSHDKYHRDCLDQAALDEFFASGAHVVDHILDVIRLHLSPDFQPQAALDFGCGVGRLTLPLAGPCSTVVGVDVSESMLAEARRNSTSRDLAHITFVKSDDALSQVTGTFDLMVSFLVFQHILPRRGEQLFQQLLQRLNPGGIAVFHVVYVSQRSPLYRWAKYWRTHLPVADGVVNLLKGRAWNTPIMELNVYNVNRLLSLFRQAGGSRVHAEFFPTADRYDGVVLYLQK
ncbi:MAG: class I SAM-dependent methyltransferase [Anaerolineae bacterium]|nr:class I SAM-dependent methyltransferase [Anaerolineae bacterium]